MDRARAEVGKVEPHKTCVFTEAGWQQYTKHIELDWSSKETPASLARWRDQASKRSGWPMVRPEPRVTYADDEKAWVKAQVHRDLGAGRDYDIAATYLGFQKLFGQRRCRTEVGIGSLMLRNKREWKEAHEASALMSGQPDQGDQEVVEGEGEKLDAEKPVEGEEQDQASEQGEEQDPEEDALMTQIEALERQNEAEDEID
jgi:hypothetical protein